MVPLQFLAELSLTLGKNMPKGYRGLGQMAERYCGVHLNKEVRGQIHYRGLDDTVLRYAAEDVKTPITELKKILHPKTSVIEGVLAEESQKLLREFFQKKR
jgi:hypothetical protein